MSSVTTFLHVAGDDPGLPDRRSALLMAVAGLAKLGNLHGFAEQMHNFRMMPVPVENLIADARCRGSSWSPRWR